MDIIVDYINAVINKKRNLSDDDLYLLYYNNYGIKPSGNILGFLYEFISETVQGLRGKKIDDIYYLNEDYNVTIFGNTIRFNYRSLDALYQMLFERLTRREIMMEQRKRKRKYIDYSLIQQPSKNQQYFDDVETDEDVEDVEQQTQQDT